MMKNFFESKRSQSAESAQLFVQSYLETSLSEELIVAMENQGISIEEMSGRIDLPKKELGRLLDDYVDELTFKHVAAICVELNLKPEFKLVGPDKSVTLNQEQKTAAFQAAVVASRGNFTDLLSNAETAVKALVLIESQGGGKS